MLGATTPRWCGRRLASSAGARSNVVKTSDSASRPVVHVSVCVPTYRRPDMLARCLEALHRQKVEDFEYSIVVIDNDANQSAQATVAAFQERISTDIVYDVEPVANISLARNKAVANAKGDLIAFIDDDEFPEGTWLANLLRAYRESAADGVLGPVLPSYEGTPPRWLVKSGLCIRRSFATGTILNDIRDMRSGNVLLSRDVIKGRHSLFDPRFGRTGGEDTDFFERTLREGRTFVWSDEARVYETVPRDRQTLRFFIKRALVLGRTAALREAFFSPGTLKSLVALIVYGTSLPILLLLGYHHFVNVFIRGCNHAAKLLAHLGIRLVRERSS